MSLIKCYWMLQNVRVTAFTVSELIRENQKVVVKVKLPPPPSPHTSRLRFFKYFNDTSFSTPFLPSAAVLPVIFCLNLNETLLLATWKLEKMPALVKNG